MASPMRLGYLATQYPAVSHTFIRREILEIERRGHTVERFAIRPAGSPVVDAADIKEYERTTRILQQGPVALAWSSLACGIASPIRMVRAMKAMWKLRQASERGWVQHAAYLAEAAYLKRACKRRGIQHLHTHFGTNSAAVAMLCRILGGPSYSLMIHGPDEFDGPIGLSIREKVDHATFVCAISDFAAAQLKRWIPRAQWGKVHVVRCTVGESFLSAGKPLTNEGPVLVCVGRLAPQKGHLVLIEAFAQALQRFPDAKLVLVGDGELRGEISSRIAEMAIGNSVELAGSLDEASVRERILASRAMVLPSFAEGLPMVFMEALALGRPVISTYVAGIPELVKPGETGWLVPAGRVDLLTMALEELLSLPLDHLNEMGRAGWRAVRDRHRTETEGEKLESLLRQAVAAQRGPDSNNPARSP